MKTYWLEIILLSYPQTFDDMATESFDAACVDGTVSQRESITKIGFAREANSLDDAVSLAVTPLETIGCEIDCIEIESRLTNPGQPPPATPLCEHV